MSSAKTLSLTLCLVAVFACAKNPVTGRREVVLVSESQEIAMGREADVQIRKEYGVVPQVSAQRYLQSVGGNLSKISHRPGLLWHFTVVDSPVVNAFAIPGGYVYVTRGILAYLNDEAELAGVVGHEITHVTARHSVRQVTRSQLAQIGLGVGSVLSPTFGRFGSIAESGLGLAFLRFSRDDEREADRIGIEYTARGGYDPREVSRFFDVLRRLQEASDRETIPGWLSTHPDPGERVQTTRALAAQWTEELGLSPDRVITNREGHFRAIDGLSFGDNPRDGFLEGQRFYHPELQFQILFPRGWSVENTRSGVYASVLNGSARMELSVLDATAGTTVDGYLRTLAQNNIHPQSGERTTINGNRAFLGTFEIPSEDGQLRALVAFIEFRERLIQIVGAASDFSRYGGTIEQSMRAFERLTDERILSAQPDRLVIYTAREGDTLISIARRTNNPRADADRLAVLNRIAVDQTLAAGRLIKTVVKGY